MSNEPAVSSTMAVDPRRRRWLVGCGLVLAACAARGQEAAASAPRLRFRSRRAVCDCAGELDEEAIDRAQAERSGRAASAAASSAGTKPAVTTKSPPTTTRRPAP